MRSHPDPQLMRAACTFGATADHAPRCAVVCCRVSSWASVVLAAPHTVSLCRVCPRRPELARPRLARMHAPTWSTTVPQPAKPYNVWRVGPPVGTSGASAFSSPQPANPHRSLHSHPTPTLTTQPGVLSCACCYTAKGNLPSHRINIRSMRRAHMDPRRIIFQLIGTNNNNNDIPTDWH